MPSSAVREAAAAARAGSCIMRYANQSVEAGTLHRRTASTKPRQGRFLRVAGEEVGDHRHVGAGDRVTHSKKGRRAACAAWTR
jgi:hypothetical protein